MSKLTGIIDHSVQFSPEKVCLYDKKKRLTFGELEQQIHASAWALQHQKVKPDDHVALLLENSIDYIITYLALLKMGTVVVPIDFSSGTDRIQFIIEDCNIRRLIIKSKTDHDYLDNNLLLESETLVNQHEKPFEYPVFDDSSLACIMYTTGSTGKPKGVVLTHSNVFASLSNISAYMGYTEDNRELVALPITHSFGLNQVLCNLMNGGFTCLIHGFANSGRILRLLKSENITNFPGTPTSYKMLLDNYKPQFIAATETLHTILINSSPLPPQLAHQILTEFQDKRLLVYYGLTEASRSTFHTHSLKLSEKHLSSVGQASPNVEVQIMDEDANILKANAEGEVVVRATTVMHSYWNNSEETKKTLVNNWFKTGDLGYLDKDGYLFLTGRIKDQINIGGLKASSAEIKNALESIENVEEAFVFGQQEDLYGEIPVACISFKTPLTRTELINLLNNKLDKFKIPHLFYHMKEIPKSITGKVLKADLLESIGKEDPIA
jgi:long-chain acyl-CoA synthetase